MFIHPHPVTIPLHGQSTDICGQAAAKKRYFLRNIQSYLWNEGTYACSKHHFTWGCILGEYQVAGACNWCDPKAAPGLRLIVHVSDCYLALHCHSWDYGLLLVADYINSSSGVRSCSGVVFDVCIFCTSTIATHPQTADDEGDPS